MPVGHSIEQLKAAGYEIEHSALGYKVSFAGEVIDEHETANAPTHPLHIESNLEMFESHARATAWNHLIGCRRG